MEHDEKQVEQFVYLQPPTPTPKFRHSLATTNRVYIEIVYY